MIGVTITGVSGRMGRMLARAVAEDRRCTLVGATALPDDPWTGRALRDVLPEADSDVVVGSIVTLVSEVVVPEGLSSGAVLQVRHNGGKVRRPQLEEGGRGM